MMSRSRAPRFGLSSVVLFACALGFGAIANGCASPPSADEAETASASSIVGGTAARIDSWPGMAHLESRGQAICGGTLVANEWVVTAAHCIQPGTPNGGVDQIVLGRQVISAGGGEKIRVAQAIVHEGYSEQTTDNDIALLRLQRTTTRPKARLVSAADWTSIAKVNLPVTVVGWGATAENGPQSNVLKQVTVPLLAHADCKQRYAREGATITANMICAGTNQGGLDSCQGDSGGPLFANVGGVPAQVGIVSWGSGCARAGVPGVYTRLTNYLTWLAAKTNGAVGAPAPAPAPDAGTPGKDAGVPDETDETDGTTGPDTTGPSDEEEGTADESGGDEADEANDADESADGSAKKKDKAKPQLASSGCTASRGHASSGVVPLLALAAIAFVAARRRRDS